MRKWMSRWIKQAQYIATLEAEIAELQLCYREMLEDLDAYGDNEERLIADVARVKEQLRESEEREADLYSSLENKQCALDETESECERLTGHLLDLVSKVLEATAPRKIRGTRLKNKARAPLPDKGEFLSAEKYNTEDR